jgi:hypothetical protein
VILLPIGVYKFRLMSSVRKWLNGAAEVLIDHFREDLDRVKAGEDWGETWMSDYLPSLYQRHYNLAFCKRFYDTMIVVAWKLKDKQWHRLDSVAEEMAMWAVLQFAAVLAENDGEHFDPRELIDDVFEDIDFQLLFHGSLDGFQEDPDMQSRLGFANLKVTEWFEPFTGHFGSAEEGAQQS